MHNFHYLDEKQLLKTLKYLNNFTLGEIASQLSIRLPKNLKKDKGFVGKLIEMYLGLRVNNKIEQDLPNLGIELKTISLERKKVPSSKVFICSVPLIRNTGLIWENSYFYKKIKKIIWIPVLKNSFNSLKHCRIVHPFLWFPSFKDLKILKKDWEEYMDLIVLGKVETIGAKLGQFLQVCIKSKNKTTYTNAIGRLGELILTHPRSFYFRKEFVETILKKYM